VVAGSEIAATADFNGDGTTDILWRGSDGAYTMWLISISNGTGTRTVAALPAMGTNWKVAGAGDFNGDGKADILWRNDSGDNTLWMMDGATRTAAPPLLTLSASTGWKVAAVDDFNGDGKADIYWRNDSKTDPSSGAQRVWVMDGSQLLFWRHIRRIVDLDWTVASSGDFDGDGKADILLRNIGTGGTRTYLLNPTADNAVPAVKAEGSAGAVVDLNWRVATTADYNGDGKSDILWHNITTGHNTLWTINGTTRTSASVVTRRPDTNWKVVGN
jgi:hypothetical protein